MNPKKIVRLSNIIGLISIILLVYWVFIFISVQVFGMRVFRQRITESFYMSVLGILALMAGALIINVMFNLTRIAQKLNMDNENTVNRGTKRAGWLLALSFPVIFVLLYGGDMLTSQKKERLMIQSAKSIVEDNKEKAEKILDYSFDKKWVAGTGETLFLLSKTDKYFPNAFVIVMDSIDYSRVLLRFTSNEREILNDTAAILKKDYLHETTKTEREYLNKVFDRQEKEMWFNAKDGNYELYYPFSKNGKVIVLYFSDYSNYGKMGS